MPTDYSYASRGSFGNGDLVSATRNGLGVSIATSRFRFTITDTEALQVYEALGELLVDGPVPYLPA